MLIKTVYCLQLADGSAYVRLVKPSKTLATATNDPELITMWVNELECKAFAMSQTLYRGLIVKKVHIRVED